MKGAGRLIRWLGYGVLGILALLALLSAWLLGADSFQRSGTARLPGLSAPVKVVRDSQGIPYIHAANLDDVIRAQGYVTAQDRLLQIEMGRYLSQGRLAEIIGEPGRRQDLQVRLAGIPRHGRRHAAILGEKDRRFFQLYLDGLNTYIETRRDEHPFGFGLLGIEPTPWSLEDLMTFRYFLNWTSAVNLEGELIALALVDRLGPDRARELAPLSVNPDDGEPVAALAAAAPMPSLGLRLDPSWQQPVSRPYEVGSNSWVAAGHRSAGGAPILANDPHMDARTLPGIWHPVGLITPDFRAVGAAGPGIPGLGVGRTSHLAFGVTNAYGDVVDLFVETVDPERPDHYLEGDRSLPFEVTEEVMRIRSRPGSSSFREETLRIRHTRRGPVISDHGMASLDPGRVITMRWSAPESMGPEVGALDFLLARSVAEARAAISRDTAPYNHTLADTAGNIAHVTGGRVPIRRRGDGSVPLPVVDDGDDWLGFIPPEEMPGAENPARGWVGNANHRTIPAGYPHAYSTYFAASWRYRRMLELLDRGDTLDAADHWSFMWDTHNLMARRLAPLMARALNEDPVTRPLGEVLAAWDHVDDPDAAGPLVFQSVFRHFARRTFTDDLGPELAATYLARYYVWHERLALLMESPDSDWFDDRDTPEREGRDDLIRAAGRDALAELSPTQGDDPARWRWGRVHTVTFFSPLVPGQALAGLLGGGTHPKDGSGETLNRATFPFDRPYGATSIASMRFVADLGDPDKVMAVLVGGASGRQWNNHLDDQVLPWLSGEPRYWWFSDRAIAADTRSRFDLIP
jgi:penicillin amidase